MLALEIIDGNQAYTRIMTLQVNAPFPEEELVIKNNE